MGATGANGAGRARTDPVAENTATRTMRTLPNGCGVALGIYGSEGRRCMAVQPAVQPSESAKNYTSRHVPTVRPGTRSPDAASGIFF